MSQKAHFFISTSLQEKIPEFEVSSHPFKVYTWIHQTLVIMLMDTQMRCSVTVCCNPDLTRTFGLNHFTLYRLFKPSLVTWEPDILTTAYCTKAHTSKHIQIILNDLICCIPPLQLTPRSAVEPLLYWLLLLPPTSLQYLASFQPTVVWNYR